jgi:hypothetical protein
MTPETKDLLALCAEHEHRSMASMMEYMVHTYAAGRSIALPLPESVAKITKTTKKP